MANVVKIVVSYNDSQVRCGYRYNDANGKIDRLAVDNQSQFPIWNKLIHVPTARSWEVTVEGGSGLVFRDISHFNLEVTVFQNEEGETRVRAPFEWHTRWPA